MAMAKKKATGPKNKFAQMDYPHKEPIPLPDHFSMVSAQLSGKHNEEAHASLKNDLMQHGFKPQEADGNYGYPEKVFVVPHKGSDSDQRTIEQIGWKHKQDSVIHSLKGKNRLAFKDGQSWEGKGHREGPHLDKYFTKLPSGHIFSPNVSKPVKKSDDTFRQALKDNTERASKITEPHYYGKIGNTHVFHAQHESHHALHGRHIHSPTDEELDGAMKDAEKNASPLVIHGNPPAALRHKAPPAHHPHNYDWHEGHTDHYLNDDDLRKDVGIPLPPHHGNDQVAQKGVDTYKPIAEKFGSVVPGHKSNLQFYRGLERAEPAIDHLIAKHGYQTYMAGGKEYGKPDLKNKNYNTGHLMIYNPKPESGGDFGNEEFTRSWRKLHELAHALTYKDVNGLYGEGRRLGKLGVRSPREAKRAVHWEWLAAHKQRDLAKDLGFHLPDEDFHKELNTVMHDAVHRAIHGQFAEPSDEGFHPSELPVDLGTSLGMIDKAAKEKNLPHENATAASPPKAGTADYPHIQVKKSEDVLAKKEDEVKDISGKLKQLHGLVDKLKEHKETLVAKDLTKSIDDPDTECSACERAADDCVCYTGLPKPRVEFEGGKLSVFFKSEWQEEDRQNFLDDLKKRMLSGVMKNRTEEAREVLGKIKKRLDDKDKSKA